MSERTLEQVSRLAELRVRYLAQIVALTADGLSDETRLEAFFVAAGFGPLARENARHLYRVRRQTVAAAVWAQGEPQRSLFAYMPGCSCPVGEVSLGHRIPGIPREVPPQWVPNRRTLEAFMRVQLERRG